MIRYDTIVKMVDMIRYRDDECDRIVKMMFRYDKIVKIMFRYDKIVKIIDIIG